MQKISLEENQSENLVQQNIEHLKQIFPEVFSEGKVNFDTLRQLLGDQKVLDEGEEKYGLNWHGKKKARQAALTPSLGTLLPCPEESVDWDNTQNLFIEGDNLEVLKLLQKSYTNKVKLIYIDPPYNTGSEFIYPDNFQENLDTYLLYTGQKDEEGNSLTSAKEKAGRKHSNWLNMMYSRLLLARSLLKDDGVLVISIDENEHVNLVKIAQEIFGEENYCGEIVWKNSSKNDQDYISIQHEYFVFFTKNKSVNKGEWLEKKEGIDEIYKAFEKFKNEHGNDWKAIHQAALDWYKTFPDSNPIKDSKHYSWMDEEGVYFASDASGPNVGQYVYEIEHPITKKNVKKPSRGWSCPKDNFLELMANNKIHFGDDETKVPCLKTYLKNTEYKSLTSLRFKDGRAASKRLRALFGENIFTNPKDEELLLDFLKALNIKENDVVLDFFAGSGTTGHAVMLHNVLNAHRVKYILVQLPESLEAMAKTATGLSKKIILNSIKYLNERSLSLNICEITKLRLKLVKEKLEESDVDESLDLGFKVFKLAQSNIQPWNPDPTDLEATLLESENHLIEGRTEQDILYELLLKRGIDLATPIAERKVAEKTVYSIGYGATFACLDEHIQAGDIESIAQLIIDWYQELAPGNKPHIFFRDSAFENDVVKTNIAAILQQNGLDHVRSL
ncbi:site-specific DNA-methyltransferase [Acinetobacter sp. YH12025]|uniref:site-specific DNA-methyltransferase n=1 Tax=Acinetobacter sp. YH12025 TaxID=2601042 RepID=UPI0015D3E000|nr:site-specific DNA-methyltransferase [Acinetobacter sp. YH12025]